jgi:glycosyltransferase involved in cell wall biosynthesis
MGTHHPGIVASTLAMNTVFFTYAYPPLKYPRSIQIARLVKYSRHRVRVLCCDDDSGKDHTLWEQGAENPIELRRFRRDGPAKYSPNWWIARILPPDPQRPWALATACALLRDGLVSAREVLVTFGDPMSDHLAGLEIRRRMNLPWIAHFSDPWSDNPYRRVSLAWLDRRLERSVLENVDRVVFTSRETMDLVMRKYPDAWRAKAVVVPHAYDPNLYGEAVAPADCLVIRYLGDLYRRRRADALVRALSLLAREKPEVLTGVRVELVGSSGGAAEKVRQADQLPPGLLTVLPPVDYLTSLRLMREAGLLLVIDAPSDHNVFLPSKLIDYIGAGRPIFAISPAGASSDLVQKLGGSVAHPERPLEIAEKLTAVLAGIQSGGNGQWGNPVVRASYAASRVVARFDELIDEVAS